MQDQNENLHAIKTAKFRNNMKIEEKHIALSLMNNDKRQHLMNTNDKLRNKLARDNKMIREEQAGETILQTVAKKHLEMVAYAPDMVKWTKKDIKKLLAEKKPIEEWS